MKSPWAIPNDPRLTEPQRRETARQDYERRRAEAAAAWGNMTPQEIEALCDADD